MTFRIVIFLSFALCTVIDGKSTRVVGGVDAERNLFPYVVSVKRISNDQHLCGGVILSRRHVVTLAAYVDDRLIDSNDLKIRAGTFADEVNNEYSNGCDYEIQEIHVHPRYNIRIEENQIYENNIAIVKIRNSFLFGMFINQIQLPSRNIVIGRLARLVGWGSNVYPVDNSPRKLRKAWMTIIDKDICSQQHNIRIRKDQFCGFQRVGVGACVGDNGSPLAFDNTLIGLVSFFNPCATEIPDVYVNVYSHYGFIQSHMI